ncbi:phosphate signaling complex protein PhoU [Dehalobacterium formicoaceticum]|uniref:Phosphate-specific transport system accessory protein PhoU n=1 Tax=Dehalobacterium formicoaceticum TaxID=51515 RepID=A0ABT1XZS5_9FIRM|nr:phosphate signaling complex protein PhoU [Dehalobacterium formicoaceticum]MCR6544117.1 phosphate signaling complex protein PhoU [Dehalobacterium formicoaceticum]
MVRENYDSQLKELRHQLLRMGSLVEEEITGSVSALVNRNVDLAQKIIADDDAVDNFHNEIEDLCLRLIATQQPIAKDLRRIVTGLKIIGELERMADHAVDIAKITLKIAPDPLIKPLIDIPRMSEYVRKMVRNSLDAYVNEDVALAESVGADDDLVDHLHNQIFRELLTYMMEDASKISQATQLLFVSRYLERIADRATNICESVIYLVTGNRQEIN